AVGHLSRMHRILAFPAYGGRVAFMPAPQVDERQGRRLAAGQPFVAELHQRQHARKEILAARREEVSVRPLALLAALHENLVADQTRKPGRQGLTRDAETPLELLETVHAEERFADDQEGPAVEHDLDRLAHGTVPLHAAV